MTDYTKKKDAELLDLISEKTRAIQTMNFSLAKSKPGEDSISANRKEIARIKTELNTRKEQTA